MDVLDEVIEFLYAGTVDPREMRDAISKMNDASEVHVPQAMNKENRRKKLVNATGMGLNALAMGAGTHALVMAGRDERLKDAAAKDKKAGKMSAARVVSKPYRAYEKTALHTKLEGKMGRGGKYAAAAAGGALALHGAELVGDSIAARALHQQRKDIGAPRSVNLSKAMEEIVQAAREGRISREVAEDLVEKGLVSATKKGAKTLKALSTAQGRAKIAQDKAFGTYTPNVLVATQPKARKAALATTAAVMGGGGLYSGMKYQQNKEYKRQFGKSITWEGEISKVDDEKRQVFGWCSVSEIDGELVTDHQNDYVPINEMEMSAYDYVIKSRKGGDMHSRVKKDWLLDEPLHVSDLIESFVVTPEKLAQMGLPENALPHGWWVGFKVNDDKVWDKVKNGERLGFSIHGSGKRTEKVV